ncbi:VOC family protein [Luteimicrobium sp. DT211]|uniref:VOC family protein n=1 Tax=Luteimicrobium sp. DT211 TaxID=3393412 RepID=UPI003CFAD6DB
MAPVLNVVGIVTRDLAASLTFYRSLGLDLPEPDGPDDHVETTLPGGLRVAWDTVELVRSLTPGWTEPSGGARITLAFLCDDASEVDATYDALVGGGYRSLHEPWDAFWGQRYATVLDPDDNPVDLFAWLPGSQH